MTRTKQAVVRPDPGPFPEALSAVSIGEYYDCAEKVVLRFLQIALLAPRPPAFRLPVALLHAPHDLALGFPPALLHALQTHSSRVVSVERVTELGGVPELGGYFRAHGTALDAAAYKTPEELPERRDFAQLLCGRAGVAYNRPDNSEVLPTAASFLGALQALFPPLPHGASPEEALGAAATFFSIPIVRELSWVDVLFSPPVTVLRSDKSRLWSLTATSETLPHAAAIDTRSHATLLVNGKPHLHINWFLRQFVGEPERSLPTLFIGHAQMFNSTASNGTAAAKAEREASVAFGPFAEGEPPE